MQTDYLIYFNAKPFYIVSVLSTPIYKLAQTAGTIIVNQPSTGIVAQTICDMEATGTHAVILLTNETERWWEVFSRHFETITAGGGIVFNPNQELLFIFRRKKWDLPKGKLDAGETIEACAVREVQEETGIQNVVIRKYFDTTYHVYEEVGKKILKKTVWFVMDADDNQSLMPQTEEDIEELAWLPESVWDKVVENTFPSIRILPWQPGGDG